MPDKKCSCKPKVGDAENTEDLNFDPNSDPNNLKVPSFQDMKDARCRMRGKLVDTPCKKSHLSDLFSMEIFLKMELFQYTGSFKERGALNTLLKLPKEQQKIGVISASMGNYAQGFAYHGALLNIKVTVVLPHITPIMKVEKCKKYKVDIIKFGENLAEAKTEALRISREKGITFMSSDHNDVIEGNGTIAMEILEKVKDLDAMVVPVGGGGMIAGCAIALKNLSPKTKLIAAIPEKCPSLEVSLQEKKATEGKTLQTLADGLQVNKIGYNAFNIIKDALYKVVKVKEEHIAVAMLRLIELEKVVAEGAGATALAAIFSGQLDEFKGKKIALVVSGGNVDTTILRRCLDRGMAAEGRMIKLKCTLPDRPGCLTELCHSINELGVGIKDILHERAWLFSDVFSVVVKLICETRDHAHAVETKKNLKEKYEDIHFLDFPEDYTPPPLF